MVGTRLSPVAARKTNQITAFSTFLLSLGITSGIILCYGPQSFTFIYDKWVGFLTAAFLMSLVQAIGCYISSFFGDQLLALGGNTGNMIYDVSRQPSGAGRADSSIVLHWPVVEPDDWSTRTQNLQ